MEVVKKKRKVMHWPITSCWGKDNVAEEKVKKRKTRYGYGQLHIFPSCVYC